jgi:hypothetical protein
MPRYSRLSSILEGKRRSAATGAGPTLRTVYPGLVYSEVNTLLTIEASGISGQWCGQSVPDAAIVVVMAVVAFLGLTSASEGASSGQR